MKTCPHCNTPCEDGDIFCTNCGYMFSADNIPAQDQNNGESQMRNYQPPDQQSPSQPNPQQPYQQPQYQQPQYNCPPPGPEGFHTPPENHKTNGLAIASLVLGIIGVLFCWCYGFGLLPSIPGLILGIIALKQIRATGQPGHGMAIAGIILSSIGLILSAIFIALFVWFFQSSAGREFIEKYKDIYGGLYH